MMPQAVFSSDIVQPHGWDGVAAGRNHAGRGSHQGGGVGEVARLRRLAARHL
jgi:hypothetical protein